jgi:hypothetical protein
MLFGGQHLSTSSQAVIIFFIWADNKFVHIRVFNTLNIYRMKKSLLLLTIIGMAYSGFSAESQGVLDFRNIFWGTPKDSVWRDGKKLEFIKDRNSLIKNAFFLPGDDLTIGAVKLDKVLYIFNDEDRFYKVFLEGTPEQEEQMKFILTYKFGDFRNETFVDDSHVMQWLVKDVTFTLKEVSKSRFELTIESSWQASENYKKNISVDDF